MKTFSPMSSAEFTTLINSIVFTNGGQQQAIQAALLQASFATFCTDYRTAGDGNSANYDAPHFNALMDMMEQARGVDVDAIARWIHAFAPVQFDKTTGYFVVNKQKVDALTLYAIDDIYEPTLDNAPSRVNTFWNWAISATHKARVTGASDEKLYAPVTNWYEFDSNTKARAKASFTSENLETRIKNLIKDCVKGGMDDAAELLTKIKPEAVAAAKLAELKHAGGITA